MKKQLYEKMKPLFPLVAHEYTDLGPLEMLLCQLARGNTFTLRVVGLETIKRFRRENPHCSITFKPNHLSEADFVVLSILFRENGLRVLMEGGNNLFIDSIDIFRDMLPRFVNPSFQALADDHCLTIAQYLTRRGAFKLFRGPVTVPQENGEEVKLGRKEILSLTRAYRHHLVSEKEMYLTFPGYSSLRSSLLDLLKMDGVKTGRSYSGKIDGFHHLPFQMDIEASMDAGVDVYIVAVNIAYERVLEDENFQELARLHDSGAPPEEIYMKDLGYILHQFCRDKRKMNLSIKFSEPRKIETKQLKGDLLGTKVKHAAHTYANETFERVMGMQPVFPASIYFSAFDEHFSRLSSQALHEKIDDIRDHLRNLVWGKQKGWIDLYYVLGYNHHIMSGEEIINRTFDLFGTPDGPITSLDGGMFVVHNREVAIQYRNHVAHFFESPKK